MSNVMVFSMFNELSDIRGFVDIGVTVDHYCSFRHISCLSHITHICVWVLFNKILKSRKQWRVWVTSKPCVYNTAELLQLFSYDFHQFRDKQWQMFYHYYITQWQKPFHYIFFFYKFWYLVKYFGIW